jgi:hypothetical protein
LRGPTTIRGLSSTERQATSIWLWPNTGAITGISRRTYVRRNAERLWPVLNGKIHFIVGRRQLRLPFTSEPKESPAFWPRRSYDFDVWSEKKLGEKLNYKHESGGPESW